MQRFDASHTRVAPLTVSMVDGVVVMRPLDDVDHLDLDATDAVLRGVAAAVSCGETVMIDVNGTPMSPTAPGEWPHGVDDDVCHLDVTALTARVVAPGCIRLGAAHETWTLDIGRRRFCRSAGPVDPKFVGADAWTPIAAVWVTAGRSTLLTTTGTYVSAPTRWTTVDHTLDHTVEARRPVVAA